MASDVRPCLFSIIRLFLAFEKGVSVNVIFVRVVEKMNRCVLLISFC